MLISIRKVFFNLKAALLILGIGLSFLVIQLLHISHYSERLGALKNQHLLVDKVINTDLNDSKMASILINGAIAELELSVKLSGEESFFDPYLNSREEQASLLRSLKISSKVFQDRALIWSESLPISQNSARELMLKAKTAFLSDIDHMIDYQIYIIQASIATTRTTAIAIVLIGLFILFLYHYRLNQIYQDIDQACAINTDGTSKTILTQEIDFLLKRLLRKSSQNSLNANLINCISGLPNEKGLLNVFNAKKSGKSGNTVFLCLFEIDHYSSLLKSLSKEDMGNVLKKLADILGMYEQPLDVVAHIENDHLVFLMSRSSKQAAFAECQKIIQSVEESNFNTEQGAIKITLSGGFLLKPPAKAIEEAVSEALTLIERAHENGNNRVEQLRERTATYR
jgi:GGDEF domain-containing protein